MKPREQPPLVVHLLYRLDFGGLETVLAECVNRMAPGTYRHAIVCLTGYTAFAEKITRPGVTIHALNKPPGLGLGTHLRLWQLLRRLRPTILHSYNLSAVEYAVTAAAAGVPVRVHAEHGRDMSDLHGKNRRHAMLRRLMTPFIDCFVPVSQDLRGWLTATVGVPDAKNRLINNGVDTAHFAPRAIVDGIGDTTQEIGDATDETVRRPADATGDEPFVIGTVGRIQDIKNQKGLVEAFLRLRADLPQMRHRLRLTIVGDGPLMPTLRAQVAASGAEDAITLLGARTDIADRMRAFDVFVLPSFNEGTPITLLEAMSCGLPVVASGVGGIPDVVAPGVCGMLITPTDIDGIAAALAAYATDPTLARRHGAAGRRIIEERYSLDAMLADYTDLYDTLCQRKLHLNSLRKPVPSCVE